MMDLSVIQSEYVVGIHFEIQSLAQSIIELRLYSL